MHPSDDQHGPLIRVTFEVAFVRSILRDRKKEGEKATYEGDEGSMLVI